MIKLLRGVAILSCRNPHEYDYEKYEACMKCPPCVARFTIERKWGTSERFMTFTKADRMCYNKRRYPSEIIANAAIGKMRATYPDAAQVNWKWYQCPICSGIHITKENQDNPEYQKRRWMSGLSVKHAS